MTGMRPLASRSIAPTAIRAAWTVVKYGTECIRDSRRMLKLSGDKVVFGATVKLIDSENEKEATYTLVGELEADIKRRLISVTSPLARGLIGKAVGDLVTVQSPGGAREYEVVEVLFEEPDEG